MSFQEIISNINWTSVITAIVVSVVIAAVLGLLLAVASKFLHVQEDPRKEFISSNLPGANCGACGYPGCGGLADAIIEGTVTKVRACKVLKADKAKEIVEYLNTTPGPDGSTLKVTE